MQRLRKIAEEATGAINDILVTPLTEDQFAKVELIIEKTVVKVMLEGKHRAVDAAPISIAIMRRGLAGSRCGRSAVMRLSLSRVSNGGADAILARPAASVQSPGTAPAPVDEEFFRPCDGNH